MPQHYTPVRDLTLAERGGVIEWRSAGPLAVEWPEPLRSLPIALGAVTLEAQRVRTIRSNGAAIFEPRFSLLAGLAGSASGFRLVASRERHGDPPHRSCTAGVTG